MKDFIFVIGPSGVGKTTLSKNLFNHYKGAYVETHMIPEFSIPTGEDPGEFEERVCWESCVSQIKKFNELGIMNVICSDLDDLRTSDIPIIFKGYNYITLKLICSNYNQNYQQMKNREYGLIDFDLLKNITRKVNNRPLLVNEVIINVSNNTPEEVLAEAIHLIEKTQSLINYEYVKPDRTLFHSWVYSNGLR